MTFRRPFALVLINHMKDRFWPDSAVGSIRQTLPLSEDKPPSAANVHDGRRCRVGPGNFTPSLSQIPDVILSHHPARAIARRLPPSAEIAGSSRFDPVGPRSTTMTHPLRSMGIAPLRRYYEVVRPSPAHRYFQPHGWSRLCLFSLGIAGQVLTFRTGAWSSFALPTRRMPLGRYQDIHRADPGGWVSPRF